MLKDFDPLKSVLNVSKSYKKNANGFNLPKFFNLKWRVQELKNYVVFNWACLGLLSNVQLHLNVIAIEILNREILTSWMWV